MEDIQNTSSGSNVRGMLVRSQQWMMLMQKLQMMQRNGTTLVHPKLLKLSEVGQRRQMLY
jgi:hypothetical protein